MTAEQCQSFEKVPRRERGDGGNRRKRGEIRTRSGTKQRCLGGKNVVEREDGFGDSGGKKSGGT